jgi:hypothetical protein
MNEKIKIPNKTLYLNYFFKFSLRFVNFNLFKQH